MERSGDSNALAGAEPDLLSPLPHDNHAELPLEARDTNGDAAERGGDVRGGIPRVSSRSTLTRCACVSHLFMLHSKVMHQCSTGCFNALLHIIKQHIRSRISCLTRCCECMRSGNGHEGLTSGEAGGSEGTTAHELSEGHSSGAAHDHHGDSQVSHRVLVIVLDMWCPPSCDCIPSFLDVSQAQQSRQL